MKKLALIISIVLGISLSASAQFGGGLFQRGATMEGDCYGSREYEEPLINFPQHGQDNDQAAPLGSGALLLIGFGAAYLRFKKR